MVAAPLPRQPTSVQIACMTILWVGAFLLNVRPGVPADVHPAALVMAFLALLSDLQSRRVSGFGQVSTSPALLVALQLWPQAGPTVATATALLSGLARLGLTRGPLALRLLEIFCSTFPVLATGAILRVLGPSPLLAAGVVALGYSFLVTFLPLIWGEPLGRRWETAWYSWFPFMRGVVCLGVALGGLAAWAPWWSLWAVPFLLSPARVVDTPELETSKQLDHQLRQTQANLSTVATDRHRIESQLSAKLDELILIQELSTELAQVHDFAHCCDIVLGWMQRMTRAASVAYYNLEPTSGLLIPLRFRSIQTKRMQDFQLLRLSEPIVSASWNARQMVCQNSPADPNRPCPEEIQTVALSLGDFGVLYAGRPRTPFSQEECQLLRILQDQALLAFFSCTRLSQYQLGLAQLSGAHRRAHRWARRRSRLLRVCRRLSAAPSMEKLTRELGRIVGRVLPYHSLHLRWREEKFQILKGGLPPSLEPLWNATQKSGRPLLIPDLSRFSTEFTQPHQAMAFPLRESHNWCGALILVGAPKPVWRRSHLQLLGIVALQLRSTLRQLELLDSVAKAYQELQQSQAQLVQSSKMAAVGQLAAGLAHEVNTPLSAIKMAVTASQRLISSDKPDRAAQRLDHVLEAVGKAEGIVQNLLFYSREGSLGRMPTRLNKVAEDTLQFLAHPLSEAHLQVFPRLLEVPEVEANPNEIQQVVTHLLLNACDAQRDLPVGERKVEIATSHRDGRVWLLVRDNGPGVPEEVRDRIFEPFFTSKEVGKGTGLGLYLSLQIAERHGGRLELLPVSEARTRGASFVFSLPT